MTKLCYFQLFWCPFSQLLHATAILYPLCRFLLFACFSSHQCCDRTHYKTQWPLEKERVMFWFSGSLKVFLLALSLRPLLYAHLQCYTALIFLASQVAAGITMWSWVCIPTNKYFFEESAELFLGLNSCSSHLDLGLVGRGWEGKGGRWLQRPAARTTFKQQVTHPWRIQLNSLACSWTSTPISGLLSQHSLVRTMTFSSLHFILNIVKMLTSEDSG